MTITEAINQTRELCDMCHTPDQSKEALRHLLRFAEIEIAKNSGKKYTTREVHKLKKWAAAEKPFVYIAEKLKRTEGGIVSKLISIKKVIYIDDKPQYLSAYRRAVLACPATN